MKFVIVKGFEFESEGGCVARVGLQTTGLSRSSPVAVQAQRSRWMRQGRTCFRLAAGSKDSVEEQCEENETLASLCVELSKGNDGLVLFEGYPMDN